MAYCLKMPGVSLRYCLTLGRKRKAGILFGLDQATDNLTRLDLVRASLASKKRINRYVMDL